MLQRISNQVHSACRPVTFSKLVWAFGKLGLRPRESFSSCVLQETDKRLTRLDTRVNRSCSTSLPFLLARCCSFDLCVK